MLVISPDSFLALLVTGAILITCLFLMAGPDGGPPKGGA